MIDKLKVGGLTYDVEFKELEAEEGVQLGWCKRTQTLIEVNNHNISEQLQKQTLIHEMTHAFLFVSWETRSHLVLIGFGKPMAL